LDSIRQQIGGWANLLPTEAMDAAETALAYAREMSEKGLRVQPPEDHIFMALRLTQPEDCKFLLLGQDPYPTWGHAMGLAFSVASDVCPIPRSLQNIYKELTSDLGIAMPTRGDLTPWAKQGGLLLNTVLTVEAGRPNSHRSHGWETFTQAIVNAVAELPQPIVFLQWGMQALRQGPKGPGAQRKDRTYICSTHPSPLSASRKSSSLPAFFGSRPFSRTNQALMSMGQEPVNWEL
jgi:uracil-DNA glycosylase